MLPLPIEILPNIFGYLATTDLLQCQLTSKGWYELSVKFLYSNVTINTTTKLGQYVRTISNSLQLGSYLKFIDPKYVLVKPWGKKTLEDHDMLKTLAWHCPNLLKIDGSIQDLSLWSQILTAVNKGGWPILQCLPRSSSKSLDIYLNTALQLKKSLTSLSLNDEYSAFGTDLNRLKVYQELLDQISEFEHLRCLNILYYSNNQISHFESLIEDCPNLREVNITLYRLEEQNIVLDSKLLANPRSNIHKLECNWKIIDSESQLKYIMQKFTNLQNLVVTINPFKEAYSTTKICSRDSVIRFLCYTLAIPAFEVSLEVAKRDIGNAWLNLIDVNDGYKDVFIDCFPIERYSETVLLNITTTSSNVRFPSHRNDTELSYTDFFSKAGHMIRSLKIRGVADIVYNINNTSILYDTLISTDWIFQIIQFCSSLQELIISGPNGNTPLGRHGFQHTEIKKLSVLNINNPRQSIHFLKYLSSNLPNMKQLHLSYNCYQTYIAGSLIVNMPETWFDLLIWEDLSHDQKSKDGFVGIYIKLITDIGPRFYLGNETGLFETSKQHYEQFDENFELDISCRNLKKLIFIYKEDQQPYELTWTF